MLGGIGDFFGTAAKWLIKYGLLFGILVYVFSRAPNMAAEEVIAVGAATLIVWGLFSLYERNQKKKATSKGDK
jgi:hypothetical protein